nr:DUF4124 domain-containing protein [Atopomonas sediminilitoris]
MFTVALLLCASGQAYADLYRYVDDKGVTVLDSNGVPAAYIGKGYEVLNSQGMVVKVVPPALTAEELAQKQAQASLAESDAKLLRLYTGVDDVDRARDRKLAEIDGVMGITRSNWQRARTQRDNLQAQAANLERGGRPVPEHMTQQINDLNKEMLRLQGEIDGFRKLKDEARAIYSKDRERVEQLTGE